MITRIFAAAVFALLIAAAPAHAAYVDTLNADVNLNFGSSEQLVGTIDLARVPYPPLAPCCFSGPYYLSGANLSLNGTSLNSVGIPLNAGQPGTVGWFNPNFDCF